MSFLFDAGGAYARGTYGGEPMVHDNPNPAARRRRDNSYESLVSHIEQTVRREEEAYQAPKPRLRREVKLPTKQPRVGGPKPKP